MGKTVEFRGVDNLVIAEVTKDNNDSGETEGYVTGTVSILAPVAEISKTVESSSENKYYDNTAHITIKSEGADTVTLTVPALDLATLGKILGKTVDETTGAFIDGEPEEKYFAIGYRLKLTDGTHRYVWRLKGTFGIPDETSATENDGTDSNNQQLTFSGVRTIHKFTKTGKNTKAVVLDERDGLCKFDSFFTTVQTPDTIETLKKSA